jgi:hypothetical protein
LAATFTLNKVKHDRSASVPNKLVGGWDVSCPEDQARGINILLDDITSGLTAHG